MIKIALATLIFFLGTSQLFFSQQEVYAYEYEGEKIIYEIDPVGTAEYNDFGLVEFQGKKLNLVTFRTRVMGFDDTEKIYLDPGSLLPVRVERDITMWTNKEYLVEEYDSKNFTLVITKFKNKKKVKGYNFKEKGPIYNAVFLPFYLRNIPKFEIGWSFDARFPEKFKITLSCVEEITVPAGKFTAYHFTSIPHKFDIWINKDEPRVPLKIKGSGGLGYALSMKEHVLMGKMKRN